MKRLITLYCFNAAIIEHKVSIVVDFKYGQEDVEVLADIPKRCPMCNHLFTELERDGLLMEIGEHAKAIISEQYPNLFIRVLLTDTIDEPLSI